MLKNLFDKIKGVVKEESPIYDEDLDEGLYTVYALLSNDNISNGGIFDEQFVFEEMNDLCELYTYICAVPNDPGGYIYIMDSTKNVKIFPNVGDVDSSRLISILQKFNRIKQNAIMITHQDLLEKKLLTKVIPKGSKISDVVSNTSFNYLLNGKEGFDQSIELLHEDALIEM